MHLKLIVPEFKRDTFVAYGTDLKDPFAAHAPWFAERHHEGKNFSNKLVDVGGKVLPLAARTIVERGEAVNATAAQQLTMQRAKELTGRVRADGAYVISELQELGTDVALAEANTVKLACGIGKKHNLDRQTGLRKLLLVQAQEQPKVAPIMARFKRPDRSAECNQMLADIDTALRNQAKEQTEAEQMQDQLDAEVAMAAETINRAIRLVNAEGDAAPKALVAAMQSAEKQHPELFRRSAGAKGDAGAAAGDTDPQGNDDITP